jgi:uroporphyrinogen decarboxylase
MRIERTKPDFGGEAGGMMSTMTGLQRTVEFIACGAVDRAPFHPIIMRWAAHYAGIKYRDFCTDYRAKCEAMIRCADDFDLDWVTVMSDAYCEASAFGLQIEYPENGLPKDVGGHLPDLEAAARLKPYRPREQSRCMNRIHEVAEFKRRVGETYFIVGWVEGPVAEYADVRGVTAAAMDFMDDPETVGKAMDVIVESSLEFITLQVKAGAHCIGIGDAFCSQIGPELYQQLAFDRERRMVDHIHSLGALAKLHICGNTHSIMPGMIATGADIIDVDHLVPSMEPFSHLLGHRQVFSGKTDPVSLIQEGTPAQIATDVADCRNQAGGRVIVSAGCEITPGTTEENMRAFRAAVVA